MELSRQVRKVCIFLWYTKVVENSFIGATVVDHEAHGRLQSVSAPAAWLPSCDYHRHAYTVRSSDRQG